MIVKSLSRKSGTGQLVSYLFKNRQSKEAEAILTHNLRSKSISGWTREFIANEALRVHKRSNAIECYHTILSFSNKDREHITPELLEDICKKFVALRGKDSIYLAVAHDDRKHKHLHIMMSATKYLIGESNRISKHQFHDLKLALDSYQREKYPALANSLPEHGARSKRLLTDKEYQLQARHGVLSQKQQIIQDVEALYHQSHSLDNFLHQLHSGGYEPYYRGGRLYGIETNDRRYRFKTMGYDTGRLEELDLRRNEEERQLQELRDLRQSRSASREIVDESRQSESDHMESYLEYDDPEI